MPQPGEWIGMPAAVRCTAGDPYGHTVEQLYSGSPDTVDAAVANWEGIGYSVSPPSYALAESGGWPASDVSALLARPADGGFARRSQPADIEAMVIDGLFLARNGFTLKAQKHIPPMLGFIGVRTCADALALGKKYVLSETSYDRDYGLRRTRLQNFVTALQAQTGYELPEDPAAVEDLDRYYTDIRHATPVLALPRLRQPRSVGRGYGYARYTGLHRTGRAFTIGDLLKMSASPQELAEASQYLVDRNRFSNFVLCDLLPFVRQCRAAMSAGVWRG